MAAAKKKAEAEAEADIRIEYVLTDDLSEASRNPKKHDDVGAIIQSIQRFGFVTPG